MNFGVLFNCQIIILPIIPDLEEKCNLSMIVNKVLQIGQQRQIDKNEISKRYKQL